MKTNYSRYVYLFAAGNTFLVFTIILIVFTTITAINPSLTWKIVIFIAASAVSGLISLVGITVLDPILHEASLVSKHLQRIEGLTNPLLVRLSSQAPGTYHHSINVSHLAEKAAKSIRADALLVRIAAYYHDIGKLDHPDLFIENQSETKRPKATKENDIRRLSQEIIDHVESGKRIARDNQLPEEIIDLIAQHHGTTQTQYFFDKAKEGGMTIKPTDFRYSGPIPQSKEAAILMLSDTLEARSRTMSILSQKAIAAIIEKTIQEKQKAGQFKHANLNKNDIQKIKKSFEKSLISIYHQRVGYKHAN